MSANSPAAHADLRTSLFRALADHLDAAPLRTALGELHRHRPEVAPKAYETKLNDPMSSEDQDRIVAMATGAHEQSLRWLFSAFNGVKINLDRFVVFGLYSSLDRADLYSIQNQPYSIMEPQVFRRPHFAPGIGCVVGQSRRPGQKRDDECLHLLDAAGQVVVAPFRSSSEPVRSYGDVDDWLVAEGLDAFAP